MPAIASSSRSIAAPCASAMPSRAPLHHPSGWRPREPWQKTAGQWSTTQPMPRNWKRIAAQVLLEEPLCRPCQAQGFIRMAREVDHIIPRTQGGMTIRANLQAICVECHRQKTNAEFEAGTMGRRSRCRP